MIMLSFQNGFPMPGSGFSRRVGYRRETAYSERPKKSVRYSTRSVTLLNKNIFSRASGTESKAMPL